MPSLRDDGAKEMKLEYGEEKNNFYWANYRAAKAEQKSLVPARQAQRINRERTSFICIL
jgi:hypothetical protein